MELQGVLPQRPALAFPKGEVLGKRPSSRMILPCLVPSKSHRERIHDKALAW